MCGNGKRRPWLLLLAAGLLLSRVAAAQRLAPTSPTHAAPRGAAPPGGACGPTAITESATQNIISGNSIACQDEGSGFTFENHYWRAFDLQDFGITGEFDVCEVDIAVEAALSVEGTQPLSVNLYSAAAGTFPAGTLTPIGSSGVVSVPDQDQSFLNISVTGSAPPGSSLVVEVVSPDGTLDLFAFFIGSNGEGQTAPSYLSAADCGITTPTDLATLGHPEMQIVMTVRGTEALITPAALDVDKAGNGVLEIGEPAVVVAPSWTNGGVSATLLLGSALNLGGPPGPVPAITDAAADYGSIVPSGTNDCADTPPVGDCYAMQITGTRPVGHVDFTFDEYVAIPTVSNGGLPPSKVWTLHIGGSFADVSTDPVADPFYKSIETLLHNGVTSGCGDGTTYCPLQNTLRQEMAVFLLRGFLGAGYAPPACTPPGQFTDVLCPGLYTDFVEDLKTRNITAGCGDGTTYCPDANVLRQEMAVFLLKTLLGGAYTPPACTPPGQFGDVPCPGTYTDFVEDLKTRGITAGCHGGVDFCPTDPVTRQEMAAFLSLTFGLVLYGP